MKTDKFYYIPAFLILLTIPLFYIQKWAIDSLLGSYTFFYSVWNIYLFHFIVTLIILMGLFLVSKKAPNYTGFAFLGSILLKMVGAVVFLIPLIKMENVSKIPDFISFFIPYFIYLFMEIVLTLRLLRQSEAQ